MKLAISIMPLDSSLPFYILISLTSIIPLSWRPCEILNWAWHYTQHRVLNFFY